METPARPIAPASWTMDALGTAIAAAPEARATDFGTGGFVASWQVIRPFYWHWMPPECDRDGNSIGAGSWGWGTSPYTEHNDFGVGVPFCPKNELGMTEIRFVHQVLLKSGIWGPLFGTESLVIAREHQTEIDQRVDFLFLQADGSVIPCEAKIAGSTKDAHGQLLRYQAELARGRLDFSLICSLLKKHLMYFQDPVAQSLQAQEIKKFLLRHDIQGKPIGFDRKSGVLVDTAFEPQTLLSVDLLNTFGFNISAYELTCFCRSPSDLHLPAEPSDEQIRRGVFRMDLRRYVGPAPAG